MVMNQKNVVKVIGIVLAFSALFKMRVGFYMNELPVILALLIAGLACMYFSSKMESVNLGENGTNSSSINKWKCSCGNYNDLGESFCSSCGTKKAVGV